MTLKCQWCVLIKNHSFLSSYQYVKINIGMNREWESNFKTPTENGVLRAVVVSCSSAELASLLSCSFPLSFAGWDKHSYGYHGDDGHSFCSSGTGQPYGPTFTTGDVIGCCVNLINNTCFYTKNGHSLGKWRKVSQERDAPALLSLLFNTSLVL